MPHRKKVKGLQRIPGGLKGLKWNLMICLSDVALQFGWFVKG